jgi:hypothetical protein
LDSIDGAVQPRASAAAATDEDKLRLALRFSTEHLLRSVQLLVTQFDGDLLAGLVLSAIDAANVSHLLPDGHEGSHEHRFAGADEAPPDELRKPVSVMAVASALGLPYETARRHVQKLVLSGRCRRVSGGIIVPASAVSGPELAALMRTNLTNIRHFYRGLKRAGFDLD